MTKYKVKQTFYLQMQEKAYEEYFFCKVSRSHQRRRQQHGKGKQQNRKRMEEEDKNGGNFLCHMKMMTLCC